MGDGGGNDGVNLKVISEELSLTHKFVYHSLLDMEMEKTTSHVCKIAF